MFVRWLKTKHSSPRFIRDFDQQHLDALSGGTSGAGPTPWKKCGRRWRDSQPWPQDQGNSCHTSPPPWDQGWMFRLDSCATVKRTPQLDGIAVLELDCTVNVQTVPFPSNISVFGARHRRYWGARRSDSSGVHQCQKPPRAIASCRVESPTQAWVLQSCRFTIQ